MSETAVAKPIEGTRLSGDSEDVADGCTKCGIKKTQKEQKESTVKWPGLPTGLARPGNERVERSLLAPLGLEMDERIDLLDCCTPDYFPDSVHLIFSNRPAGQRANNGYGWTQLWMGDTEGKELTIDN